MSQPTNVGQRVRQRLAEWIAPDMKRSPRVIFESGVGGAWGEPPPSSTTAEPTLYYLSEAVNAAVTAFANRTSAARLRLMRERADGELEDVQSHPALRLLENPNPYMTRSELLWHVPSDLKLAGNAYWFLAGPARGAPTEIWRCNPRHMRIVIDERDYIRGYMYDVNGQTVPLDASEVIHLRNFAPTTEHYGIPTLLAAAAQASTGHAMTAWNRRMFEKDYGIPAGLVTVEENVSEADWARFKAEWRAQYGGGQRRTGFLRGGGVDFKAVGLTQTDVDFLEGSKWSAEQVYRVFGTYHLLPAQYSDDRKVNERMFLEEHAWPLLTYVAEVLTDRLLPFWGPVFGTGRLVAQFDDIRPRERALELQEQEQEAKGLTLNEWRIARGLDPLDGGNDILFIHAVNGEKVKFERDALPSPEPPATPATMAEEMTAEEPDDDADAQDAQENAEDRESAGNDIGDDIGDSVDKSAPATTHQWQWDTDAMHRELATWQRWQIRRVKGQASDGREFEAEHLPAWYADALRYVVSTAADIEAVKVAFAQAHEWIDARVKAIQATRLNFEADFEDLLTAAREEDVTRREWAQRLRTLLRRYGTKAYRDGLNDGGVAIDDDEPLDMEDQADINAMLADQSQYVTDLGAVLFKGDGITDAQAEQKPALWYNKSIHPFYVAGNASADKNGMREWVLGPTEEHCSTCATASGQRHRLRDWMRRGIMPKADELECGGWNCECALVPTAERARGRLDAIPMH